MSHWFHDASEDMSWTFIVIAIVVSTVKFLIVGSLLLYFLPKYVDVGYSEILSISLLFIFLCYKCLVIIFPSEVILTGSQFKSKFPRFKNYRKAKQHAKYLSSVRNSIYYSNRSSISIDVKFELLGFNTKTRKYVYKQVMSNNEIKILREKIINACERDLNSQSERETYIDYLARELNNRTLLEIEKYKREVSTVPLVKEIEHP